MDPIQFDFRWTDQELVESLKQNGAFSGSRWRGFAVVFVCLVPSAYIFLQIESEMSLIWVLVMMAVLAVYAIRAFLSKPTIENYDQQLMLSDSLLQNKFSHSVVQTKWNEFESIEETKDSFRILRMGRSTVIPKRVIEEQLESEKVESLKQFLTTANDRPAVSEPVGLYTEMLEAPGQFPVYRFRYCEEDIEQAIGSRFVLANSSSELSNTIVVNNPSRIRWWIWAILAIGACAAFYRMGVHTPSPMQVPLSGGMGFEIEASLQTVLPNRALLAVGWVLPVALVFIIGKFWRVVAARKTGVPDDEIAVRLTPNGWISGSPDGALHYDWRDVESIHDSPHFFGFKTINQLMSVIPKRIFEDSNAARSFLASAVEMQKRSQYEKTHSNVPTATIVETGNPYQSPTG